MMPTLINNQAVDACFLPEFTVVITTPAGFPVKGLPLMQLLVQEGFQLLRQGLI